MTTSKQPKPRTRWDKYRCEWHIGGNYTNNAAIVSQKIPQRRLLQRTIKLIREGCRLDQILRFRQDWVVFDSKGRTDLVKTKQNVQTELLKIKNQVIAMGYSGSFLDEPIKSGFKEAQRPAAQPTSLTRLKKELDDLGLEKL
jgi:hypothetical protein